MAASSVASPLCTWLVAACMFVDYEKDHYLFQSSRRLSKWARNKKSFLLQSITTGTTGGVTGERGLISSICESSFQGLMSSCLAFEPCEDFNGYYGLSLFGSKTAAHVGLIGNYISLKWFSVLFLIFINFPYYKRIAGEIKSFSTDGWVAPKFSRRMDKFMPYMLTAGKKALADAGISEEIMSEIDKTRCGVLIGSAMGGMKASLNFSYFKIVFNDAIEALRISYRKMNPFCVPFATTNMGSAMLAMDLGWMGPNYSVSTACATSNFCILNAANHIIRGEAGKKNSEHDALWLGRFCGMQSTFTKKWGSNKSFTPLRYFGICYRDYQNRDGFVMGEGAGVLLLEELEHAKRRGVNIYAEFLDVSFTCDAYHMTEPHPYGEEVILCIEKAFAHSVVAREDVKYINAHATSTQVGDMKEYEALIRCFGKNPKGHNMIVVETDGHYVEPFLVKNLNSYSGETYSVLVKADQDPLRNYWAVFNVISQKPATPTSLATSINLQFTTKRVVCLLVFTVVLLHELKISGYLSFSPPSTTFFAFSLSILSISDYPTVGNTARNMTRSTLSSSSSIGSLSKQQT
ncbi:hypothetical protein GIB67_042291 [Kingdonia uniflora]|uniref:beta-ketoacyl-[acyl-carrier-protein] synthase I n=1 Tax=Kingdonia uniflora TaxID=39325 RepID=A0A7J7LE74_9MAGN|nr:hypothetical protein GIB67_042291 [Kingdonia uniflora]